MRKKLAVAIVMYLMAAFFTAVGIYTLYSAQNMLVERIIGERETAAVSMAERIAVGLEQYSNTVENDLRLISIGYEEIYAGDTDICNTHIEHAFGEFRHPWIYAIVRVNASGVATCATAERRSAIGSSYLDDRGNPTDSSYLNNSYVREMFADSAHKMTIGHPFKEGNSSYVMMAVPLYDDDGNFTGALLGYLPVDAIYDIYLKGAGFSAHGYPAVLDQEGYQVYHANPNFTTLNVWSDYMQTATGGVPSLRQLWSESTAGKTGYIRYTLSDVDKIAAYAPAHVTSGLVWAVNITMPVSDILSDIEKMGLYSAFQLLYAILAILLFGFVTVFLFYLYRSVFDPIERMTKTIDEISMGQLDTEVDPGMLKSDDELGDLARAFDRTMVSLKLAMKKLRKPGKP